MAVGRKPKPTALKIITGNPGQRPLPKNEPVVIDESMPLPPAHLSELAIEEWGRVSQSLYDCSILTVIDRAALGAYCQAYARWAEAEIELAVDGELVVKNPTSGAVAQNPLVGIAAKAATDMVKFAAEFGMTPSARSRVEVKVRDNETKASRYLA